MRAKPFAAITPIAAAFALAGCPGDPKRVDPDVEAKVFRTADGLVAAVNGGNAVAACARLTLEAQIEVEDWVRRRSGLTARPSCPDAISARAFLERCGVPWRRTHGLAAMYRKDDLDEFASKPGVAWAAVTRNGRLIGRCELRLTHDEGDWRINSIALQQDHSVLERSPDRLVFRDGKPAKSLR